MNKKGFTLVEVLAILVVLSLLMLIVLPQINGSTDSKKTDQYNKLVKTILNAAKVYHTENSSSYIIKLDTLTSNKYLDKTINPVTNTYFDGCVKVTLYNGIYNYEYSENECVTAAEDLIETYNNGRTDMIKITYDDLFEESESTDDTTHTVYRFVGSSNDVNNYIMFNNELWRIIGVFDNKLKIIRDSYITDSSYDSSIKSTNNGYGINDWATSSLSTNLNGYYYGTNEHYYYCNDKEQDVCYLEDLAMSKLSANAKKIVDMNHLWYVGSSNNSYDTISTVYTSLDAFINEHKFTGKICTESDNCNDNIKRSLTWLGEVGLMSLSDYSYAGNCTDYRDCGENNWLAKENSMFINPSATDASSVWMTNSDKNAVELPAYTLKHIYPVVYLTENIYIESGTGTSIDPYVLNI